LNKFKYNHSIFESLLAKQKSVEVTAEGVGIMFGNPDAKNRIIKVCNPFCGPCAKAHLEIEKIVNANRNIKAQIIFTATPDIKDQKYIVVRHLMAIASNTNPLIMKNALDNWYLSPKKDYAAFARKYPMGKELNEQDDKIRLMHDWCVSSDVTFTPTIFVNDHQLPELYNVADLYYLLN
jgi:protein-disulfide isomerase